MKHIVIFGAGKSATVCINYLATKALNHFKLSVADVSAELLAEKTAQFDHVHRVVLDISNDNDRSALIATADVVISLLPPHLHIKAAIDCLHHKKHLINASYVAPEIRALDSEAIKNNLLFLSEMGLDPGIDHMSAMALIHQLQEEGNTITSFYSHCGGLVAPESDNNPWHYKISWNPRNVVLAGKSGATFLENGITKTLTYENLFNENNLINKNTANEFAWYANRDSLSYINTYNLQGVSNFLRTTLRHKKFIEAWKEIVVLGLTDDTEKHTSVAGIQSLDIDNYTKATQYLLDKELIKNYSATNFTNADLLQYLLEHKLALKPEDKDMIVMQHDIEYFTLNNEKKQTTSFLKLVGKNNRETAMAATVGLPLAIAALLVLNNEIKIYGVQIPIHKDIYAPVLAELKNNGIVFEEHTTTL